MIRSTVNTVRSRIEAGPRRCWAPIGHTVGRFTFGLLAFVFACHLAVPAWGQTKDDCLMCHGDPDLTAERQGREVSLYIDGDSLTASVHGDMPCVACHAELENTDFPHETNLAPVDCGTCHEKIATKNAASLHGQATKAGLPLAPRCWDCHGSHDIAPVRSRHSRVAKLNIPFVCGRCHKEGTKVSQTYDIPQDSILAHYSLSIHGAGLFRQGLTVTAVCTDCHTAHSILPHTDPRSTISRKNVARTCEQCHGNIEQVHQKVIRGELWEKEPNKVPVCVDCHAPHKARKIFYELGMSDRDCLKCHANPELSTVRDGDTISLYVDSTEVHNSIHRNKACAQCHTGVSTAERRPCATITSRVDCSICHAEVVSTYKTSTHGVLADRGDPNAPQCDDCHSPHGTRDHRDPRSPTYPTHVPDLCGQCHREGARAARRYSGDEHRIVGNYVQSIHGKGLLESGLVVTAMCTDCHTAHHVLPHSDSASSISRQQIAKTCARCHNGIYEQFSKSIHSPLVAKTDKPLPVCNDCHSAHMISRTDETGFELGVMNQCGRCHPEVSKTYFETFHGKVSKLGYTGAAKCYDCHGAHDVLPPDDPRSHLSRQNIVETCGKCHKGSHRQFAGYLTHATHHNRDKYPILFYTFWFMTILLAGTFLVAGTHTLLWLPRSFRELKERKRLRSRSRGIVVRRFTRRQRQLHVLVIISFLGLALTGMTLKFSYLGWARWISHLLGGFESAGYIHRICALITFFYFGMHLFEVVRDKRRSNQTWKQYLRGPDTMLPNRNDLRDLAATFKWFLGMGPRPDYGRWTYWEKFDYFAVFWGVLIIGSTGLLLWFPEFFTWLLPGWFINVATIVHSDEALLAVGFIFTVHFFNTHFRPDRFPMDPVIFTGRIPIEEFKRERRREYDALVQTGRLKEHLTEPLPEVVVRGMKIFGGIALCTGIILILLIIWAEMFGYR